MSSPYSHCRAWATLFYCCHHVSVSRLILVFWKRQIARTFSTLHPYRRPFKRYNKRSNPSTHLLSHINLYIRNVQNFQISNAVIRHQRKLRNGRSSFIHRDPRVFRNPSFRLIGLAYRIILVVKHIELYSHFPSSITMVFLPCSDHSSTLSLSRSIMRIYLLPARMC